MVVFVVVDELFLRRIRNSAQRSISSRVTRVRGRIDGSKGYLGQLPKNRARPQGYEVRDAAAEARADSLTEGTILDAAT